MAMPNKCLPARKPFVGDPTRTFAAGRALPAAYAAHGSTSRSISRPHSRRALVRSCVACRPNQNSGLVRKNRASRNAVSAVTARSPLIIAPTRVAGTRKAIASAFADMPSGLRNSSLSTSPGWVVTRSGVAAPSAGLRLVPRRSDYDSLSWALGLAIGSG